MTQAELIMKLLEMGPEEGIKFLNRHVITSDSLHGQVQLTPREEFDPESVDFVVCGPALPDAYRVDGAIDVECDDCKVLVILSPSSPVKPPKLCFSCASARQRVEKVFLE